MNFLRYIRPIILPTGGAAFIAYANFGTTTSIANASSSQSKSVKFNKIKSIDSNDEAHLINWSRTHEAKPNLFFEPDSVQQLLDLVQYAHQTSRKLRPCGTFLSPNGLAQGKDMMVSLAGLDRIKNINLERQEVTVEAGIVVDQLLQELSKFNLTLENFSSIKEQQMGGWTQVAAHGTGATLPTVDEMIINMKIVTPAEGELELSNEKEPELFKLARVGLGSLGIVTELTLKCIPIHKLHEKTYVLHNDQDVRKTHKELLQKYRHVRYMWIPSTTDCVVVVSNPITEEAEEEGEEEEQTEESSIPLPLPPPPPSSSASSSSTSNNVLDPRRHLRALLTQVQPESTVSTTASFSQLRDQLLAYNPLNQEWVKRVNLVESKFWSDNSGERTDWSDAILGFDCGGAQWVFEMSLPCGTLQEPNYADLDFINDLRNDLAIAGLPAPAPIEQRWTASSSSPMSPAFSTNKNEIFSWVGGIMYMPDDENREAITVQFRAYMKIMNTLAERYGAHAHWAKIELPQEDDVKYSLQLMKMKRRLREKYPVKAFNEARKRLDPKGILSNGMIDTLFGSSGSDL